MTEQSDTVKKSRWNSPIPFRWFLVMMGGIAALQILLACLGVERYSFPIVMTAMAYGIAVHSNWAYHNQTWFWIVLVLFAPLHALFIVWSAQAVFAGRSFGGQGRGLAAIPLVDAAIMTAIIRGPSAIKNIYSPYTGAEKEETVTK